jgi:hypothetical protein
MKEKETQAAAMLSLAVHSAFDVKFMIGPLSEWRGTLSGSRGSEKGGLVLINTIIGL